MDLLYLCIGTNVLLIGSKYNPEWYAQGPRRDEHVMQILANGHVVPSHIMALSLHPGCTTNFRQA